jgi:hypothetical protein
MQGSNNFWLPPREGWLLKKMIKEDHLLACTTKMFEILVALPHQIRQTRTSRVTTWIARTAQVHLSFRTHILAAIRLFTCQRASYPYAEHLVEVQRLFTANVGGNFRYRRRGSRSGVADISVSFGGVNRCRRTFFRRVAGRFIGRLEATRGPEPIDRFRTGSNLHELFGAASAAFDRLR